jgi:hypothetical protein
MASPNAYPRHPSKKKLFLLVVFVIASLTFAGLFLILRSLRIERSPQVPTTQPISLLSTPQITHIAS